MSSNVKLTSQAVSTDAAVTPPGRPLLLVALGTALVLVTYVTPMATVPVTAADLVAGSAPAPAPGS